MSLSFPELMAACEALLTRSEALRRIAAFDPPTDALLVAAGAGTAILLGAFLFRRLRPTGALSLRIEFPEAVEGEFEIFLQRRSPKRARGSNGRRERRPVRRGVRRETQIDAIAPGLWFLTLEGVLQTPRSHALLAEVDEEIEVWIDADRCAAIVHALPTVEAPVELRVHWDRQPARDVGLCVDGRPQTLRYSANGQLKTTLSLGGHTLVVGAGDRVVERTVRIESYEPKVIHMDLAAPEGLVFKGCPPAVNAFLQGDLGAAARALDRDGQTAIGSGLLARLHQ